jgi:hypothetical protein
MADRWYYWHDSDILGPFSTTEFGALAASGVLLPTDTVWKGDDDRGVPAHRVRNLFPAAALVSPAPAESPTADAAAVPLAATQPTANTVGEAAAEEAAPRWDAVRQPSPAGRARAVAGKGALIVAQDGTTVKFRKKCTTCGHEDSSWKTIPIPRGTVRVPFYCPKCRKQRQVEVHGQTQ